MCPQFQFHEALNFHSITEFLHHCSQIKNLKSIQEFHAHLLRSDLFVVSPNLQTKLLFTYISCLGADSLKILTRFSKCLNTKNPLPFNSMISHFSQNGYHSHSLHTLSFMHYSGIYVDSFALCSSVKSASFLKGICFGKIIHAYVEKSGWLTSVFVGSALVDFYSKLLYINDAAKLFDEMPEKNTVCVNALLMGYGEAKLWRRGIELVRRMHCMNLIADNFTMCAALRASIGLNAVELGKQIHVSVIRNVILFGTDVVLQSLLVEMYGKSGLVESAKRVFDMDGFEGGEKRQRDVILWTSILDAYGKNGKSMEVIGLFEDMLKEGIRPDEVAFLIVVSACSHAGQVDLGMEYFESMARDYGLVPSQEHYSCVVDLLCRRGELDRAWKLISEIPKAESDSGRVSMWGTLLNACNECGDVNLGKWAAERALELDSANVGIYVLLSNMYARNGMWDEIEQLRDSMRRKGLQKDIGCSWTER